jgi:hypothetical protein
MPKVKPPEAAAPKSAGRPSLYTDAVASEICERLSKGEPLAVICRDEHMPGYRTVFDWQNTRPEFSAAIAHAREAGFDEIAAECLAIADHTANDTKFIASENGNERAVPDSEWISRSKLRVETRLKLLAKWDPKRYGDRLNLDHSGEMKVTLTAEQRKARIAELMTKAASAVGD